MCPEAPPTTGSPAAECDVLARKLMTLWSAQPPVPCWDEVLGELHEHPDAQHFEIATALLDSTTFYLDLSSGALRVNVKRLDNYKLHLKAKFIESTMDGQDWLDLRDTLARLVRDFRGLAALQTLDLEASWEALIDALFAPPELGTRPARRPALKRNAHQLALGLQETLERSGRSASFEWRAWSDYGLRALQDLPALQALGIVLAPPSESERQFVVELSDDFRQAVLDWFGARLAPHGLGLIALSPIDEDQAFALVRIDGFDAVRAALGTLCIHFEESTR